MNRPTDSDLYEQLADIQHEIWSHWMRYLFSRATPHIEGDGRVVLSAADSEQWARQMLTPYADLTEREKASDREQVDKFWELITGNRVQLINRVWGQVRSAHGRGVEGCPGPTYEDVCRVVGWVPDEKSADG